MKRLLLALLVTTFMAADTDELLAQAGANYDESKVPQYTLPDPLVLADGTKVNGPVALRSAILSRPEAFMTVLTERIMTYALGRGVEPSDMPVVRSIVKKAGQNNYRLASVVQSIVESAPFQMRTRLEPEGTPNRVAQSQPK